jgi:hypothetical protein
LKGATKGDGGIASTIDDLLRWDQALTAGKLVGAKTLAEAFVPARVEEGTSTYAFGWNVAQRNGDTLVWHTGNSGGQRAFLGRRIGDRLTVIILTQGDSRRLEIADAIVDILHHRPFTPPRLSVARKMLAIVDSKGVDGAIALYHQLKTAEPNGYDFSEPELNGVGYALLGRRDTAGAIRVFELNAQLFPKSSNVFDSLGEALAAAGRRDDAVKAYSRSRARSKQHQRANDAQEVEILASSRECATPAGEARPVDFELPPAHTPCSERTGAPPVRGKGACSHPQSGSRVTRTFFRPETKRTPGRTLDSLEATEGRFRCPARSRPRPLSTISGKKRSAGSRRCERASPTRARDSNAPGPPRR